MVFQWLACHDDREFLSWLWWWHRMILEIKLWWWHGMIYEIRLSSTVKYSFFWRIMILLNSKHSGIHREETACFLQVEWLQCGWSFSLYSHYENHEDGDDDDNDDLIIKMMMTMMMMMMIFAFKLLLRRALVVRQLDYHYDYGRDDFDRWHYYYGKNTCKHHCHHYSRWLWLFKLTL